MSGLARGAGALARRAAAAAPVLVMGLAMGLAAAACGGDAADAPEVIDTSAHCTATTCERDAGDEAWVKQTLPLVLGRRAHGMQEVRALVDLVQRSDRAAVARGLMEAPEFEQRWTEWLLAELRVVKLGVRSHRECFETPRRTSDDGDLAAWLRDTPPTATLGGGAGGVAGFGEPFNMADVLRSSLRLDDLSPLMRAYVFPMTSRPLAYCNNIDPDAMEWARRDELGSRFVSVYTHREAECLTCHNGEFSVNDHPDPAEDHFWPVPGRFERALFGAPTGRALGELSSVFRVRGVLSFESVTDKHEKEDDWPADVAAPVTPWGMDESCGLFHAPTDMPADDLDGGAYLGGELGPEASIWDLEALLDAGVAHFREAGPRSYADDEAIPPGEALVHLAAQRWMNRLWAEAFGRHLTLSHHFPRNADQRDLLMDLTHVFLEGGFSLRTALEAVVLHPLFNVQAPEDGPSDDSGAPFVLPPVFDPFSPEDAEPARRANSVGDRVVRPSGPVLLSMAAEALEWPAFPSFPEWTQVGYLQSAGVFVSEHEPGFRGVDFQNRLMWEGLVGQCRPEPNNTDTCYESSCYAFDPDWLDALADRAEASGATVEDAVVALKDRLITEPTLHSGERALVAEWFGLSGTSALGEPLTSAPEWRDRLRGFCGLMLNTPQFLLVGLAEADQSAPATLVVGGEDQAHFCERHAAAVAAAGGPPLSCE